MFVDANLLYSRTLRDWLGLLSTREEIEPPFQVYWSEDVLAEAIYRLRRDNPTWDGQKIATIRDRIAQTFPDGRVVEFEIDSDTGLADPFDAHVHAAAVACAANYVVTSDGGFSRASDDLPYDVLTPDEFFCLVDDVASMLVELCIRAELAYYQRKTGRADLVEAARRAGCPAFAERIRRHLKHQALTG